MNQNSLLQIFQKALVQAAKYIPNFLILKLNDIFFNLKDFLFSRKDRFYRLASIIDFVLIMVILAHGAKPVEQFFSPLISSGNKQLSLLFKNKLTSEVFSFAPGQSGNLSKIDFAGLNYLAFFDAPLLASGDINTDSYGYSSYRQANSDLFPVGRAYGTKILLTLSQLNNQTIESFLTDEAAKANAIESVAAEINDAKIDGVDLAFEYKGDNSYLKSKFSDFVRDFTAQLHDKAPNSIVAVSIPDTQVNKSIFDMKSLSKGADKVFIIAASFPAPEVKNQIPSTPVYGQSNSDYWGRVSESINKFLSFVPSDKLVMERAWYGSGDNLPMYVPSDKPVEPKNAQVYNGIDQQTLNNLVAEVPFEAQAAARANIPYIAKALAREGILNSNVLAYALATIEHETAGTFEPLEEYSGRISARRLGYEGGENYFGRGFIQLTHLRNYRLVGERIGMGDELVKHPEMASQPEVAARILAAFFADNNVSNLASAGNYIAARGPINPDRNGWAVANLAWKYESEEVNLEY